MRKRVYMRQAKALEKCRNQECGRVFKVLSWHKGLTRCPFCDWPAAASEMTLTEDADERSLLARERLEDAS